MGWAAHEETFVGRPCGVDLLFVAAAVEPFVVVDVVAAFDAAFAVEVEEQEVLAVPFLVVDVVDPSVVVAAAFQVC